MKGQLRDAAEGGRREDTEADRAQATARMGARLAVDRLGRLALGKKKARSWSGEDRPDAGAPGPITGNTQPATQAEPSAPYSGTGPVRIKTREAAHGGPAANFGRADLPRADQPIVKTKDTYLRRHATGQVQAKRQTGSTPKTGESAHAEYPSQPVIRTKESCSHQHGVSSEQISEKIVPGLSPDRSPDYPPQLMERGRQRFVRERAHQAVQRRNQNVGGAVFAQVERQSATDESTLASRSGAARTEAPFNSETVRERRSDGKCPVKTARSGRTPVGKPGWQRVTSTVDTPGRPAEAANRSASRAQQTTRAVSQARQRAVKAAGEARRTVAAMDRPVVKAAASALRGAVSGIRAAMAPLAAGGGAVIAVVLVLCLVAALIMSPLGIFFNSEETNGQTIAAAVREINQEYSVKLEELASGIVYDQFSMAGVRAP